MKLAIEIIEITGSSSSIIFDEPRVGDIRQSQADIIGKLGFKPRFSIEEGLLRTIELHRKLIKENNFLM